MRFDPTPLPGACVIEMERHQDERGFFARTYCASEFREQGLHTEWPQCNTSYNLRAGTLRGLHWQAEPHAEVKLVRCTAGAVFDVIVDLRPDSPAYLHHFGVELTADNRKQLYIPKGFAHGFITLTDDTEVFYHMGSSYVPGSAQGARYDDPAFGITWPRPVTVISDRDQNYADYVG